VFRQCVEHTSTTVHAAVTARERSRQYHKVDNTRRCGNADFGESQYERAAVTAYFIPREDGDDNENRAYVENQDTPQHFAYGTAQRHLRILRFTGSNANQLHALVGRHHNTQRGQEPFPATRKETAM